MYACVLPAYICVHRGYAVLMEPEKGIRYLGTGVIDTHEPPCGFWEWNPVLWKIS